MPDRLTGLTLVVATGHDLSLALLSDGAVIAACDEPMSKGHAEAVVPAIAALLQPFGGHAVRCDRVVVETGPGSFTGLRVGLAAATALALAWRAKLFGVRSTELVAAEARAIGIGAKLLVALGAPRGQVWLEGFAAEGLASLGAPEALSPEDALMRARDFPAIAGSAAMVAERGGHRVSPRAGAVASLAATALGEAELLYVRAADSAQVA